MAKKKTNNCFDVMEKDYLRQEMKEALVKRRKKLGPDFDQYEVNVVIRELTAERLKAIRSKKFEAAKQFVAERRLLTEYMRHNFKGGAETTNGYNPARGAYMAWTRDARGEQPFSSVTSRTSSLIAEVMRHLQGNASIRRRLFSMSSGMKKDLNKNILSEIRGKKTGDDIASEIAQGYRKAIDEAWVKYKMAGGKGGTIKEYVPQHWLPYRVHRAGKDQWVADAMKYIDRQSMRDVEDGHLLDDEELKDLLEYSWDSITMYGANKWSDPGIPPNAKSALKNRRDNSRVIHFTREGDIAMREKYMDPDINTAILKYLEDLLEDTAIMQILGPNPNKTWKVVDNSIAHEITKLKNSANRPSVNMIVRMENTRNELAKIHRLTVRERDPIQGELQHFFAQADQTVRFGTTALLLGGALIPSTSDFATQGLNAWLRGTGFLNRIAQYAKFMANSEDTVRDAIGDMIVYQTVLNADATTSRMLGNSVDRLQGRMGKSAELVLEKSGLTAHTDASRLAAIRSHQFALGDDSKISWFKLKDNRRAQYESYGFTKEDWDTLNKTDLGNVSLYGHNRGYFDFNKAREKLKEPLFRRLHEMVMTEGERSVITTDVRAESVLNTVTLGHGTAPGSMRGILSSNLKMFKRFPIGAALNLREAALNPHIPGWTKTIGIGAWFLSASSIGMMALQARQVLQGRTPIAVTDEDGNWNYGFFFAGVLYGGGLPFIGDVLPEMLGVNTDTLQSRGYHAKGWLDMLPSVGLGRRILRPFGDAWEQMIEGDIDGMVGTLSGEAVAEVGRNVAALYGGNIWYARAALDHILFQQWEQIFDPSGFEDKTERQRNYLEGQGNDFWWQPGTVVP